MSQEQTNQIEEVNQLAAHLATVSTGLAEAVRLREMWSNTFPDIGVANFDDDRTRLRYSSMMMNPIFIARTPQVIKDIVVTMLLFNIDVAITTNDNVRILVGEQMRSDPLSPHFNSLYNLINQYAIGQIAQDDWI